MTDHYEIHLKGHLDCEWEEYFTGFSFSHRPNGATVLSGPVADQPALHGLLARISQLGLPLLKVQQMNAEADDE